MKLNIQLFAAGVLVIGTEVDDKEFYKKIKEFESIKTPTIEINAELNTEQIQKEIIKAYSKLQEIKKTEVLDEEQISYAKRLLSYIEAANARIKDLGGREVIIPGLNDASKSLQEIEQISNKIELDKVEKQLRKVGNSINKIVSKVGRWALAVIGVRSAYSLVRRSISELSQTDDGLKARIDYVTWAIANTLKPLIEWVIKAIYNILGIVGGIVKLITGKNIFKKSGVKDFQKSLNSSNKTAKELRKTLAGFDEMNILNEDGSVGTKIPGSGGVNIPVDMPDLDELSNSWADKITKFGKKFKKWFLGGDYDNLGEALLEGVKKVPSNLYNLFKPVNSIVYNNVIKPIIDNLKVIKEYTRPMWEPMANGLKEAYTNTIKPTFEKIGNLISPLKNKLAEWKNEMLKMLAPFFNTIIDWINNTFGVFGIHIDRIEIDEKELTNDILKNMEEIAQKKIPPKQMMFEFAAETAKANASLSSFANNLKTKMQKAVDSINFKSMANGMLKLFEKIPGFPIATLKKNLKLAKGGIVNMPGRGIPYGGATIAEQRPEGIIPLTDSQQMALLGEAIGKYITINASITNTMNGRVISKELQKINAENDFAYNR